MFEYLVGQSSSLSSLNKRSQSIHRINPEIPLIHLENKLTNIQPSVFFTETAIICTIIFAFQYGPNALNVAGVRHAVNKVLCRVFDCFMGIVNGTYKSPYAPHLSVQTVDSERTLALIIGSTVRELTADMTFSTVPFDPSCP